MKKKCGHEVGYRCCCNFHYTAEHSFDLVDEISHKKRRHKDRGFVIEPDGLFPEEQD